MAATPWSLESSIPGGFRALAWDPQNRWIASDQIADCAVTSVGDWVNIAASPLTDPTQAITCAEFSRDGAWLALGSADSNLYIYDTSTWALSTTLTDAGAAIRSVAFSNGELVFGEDNNFLYIKEVGTWANIATVSYASTPFDVSFSPTQEYLGASVQTAQDVVVLETTNWTEIAQSPFTNPTEQIWGFDWGPGDYFAASGEGGTTWIYESANWSLVTSFSVTTAAVRSVSFSRNGVWLAYGTSDANNSSYIYEVGTWTQVTGSPLAGAGHNEDTDFNSTNDWYAHNKEVYSTEPVPIEGTVTLDGTPQQGATVYIIDTATDSVVATLTTDVNGAFSYTPSASGPFHVAAEHEDGAVKYNAPSYPHIV